MSYNLQNDLPHDSNGADDSCVCVGYTSTGDTQYYSNDKLCTITQPHIVNDLPQPGFSWDDFSILTQPAIKDQFELPTKRMPEKEATHDPVNHPSHYTYGKIETIDYIEDKGQGFNLGNAVKYISRAGHKLNTIEDLEKAVWYINREIMRLKKVNNDGGDTATT